MRRYVGSYTDMPFGYGKEGRKEAKEYIAKHPSVSALRTVGTRGRVYLSPHNEFYMDDRHYGVFYPTIESDTPYSETELMDNVDKPSHMDIIHASFIHEWTLWINSPWEFTNDIYTIELILSVTKDKPTYLYKCTHGVACYDGICADIIGYGKTDTAALKNCDKLFKYLQDHYNTEHDAI